MIGPGKYDAFCSLARAMTSAEGVIVVVVNGHLGTGFSAQLPLHLQLAMPAMLRQIADQIETGTAG